MRRRREKGFTAEMILRRALLHVMDRLAAVCYCSSAEQELEGLRSAYLLLLDMSGRITAELREIA